MVGIWGKRDEGCMPPLEDEIPPPLVSSKTQGSGQKRNSNLQKNTEVRSRYQPLFPELSDDSFSNDEERIERNKHVGEARMIQETLEATYYVHSSDSSDDEVSTGLVEPPILMGLVANSAGWKNGSGSWSIPMFPLNSEVGNAGGHSFFMSQEPYFDPVIPPRHFGYSMSGFGSGLHGNGGMSLEDQCEHRVQRMMRIIRRQNDDEDDEDDINTIA